jgi:hypothetical protein
LSKPIAVKLAMKCPYCNCEVYCMLTKQELKRVMKGFKMQTDNANIQIHLKVNERGYAEWQKRRV